MTDLTPAPTTTIACPGCGAQNARGARRCEDCGQVLGNEAPRDGLELEEAWRAAAAGGYDTEVAFAGGRLTCSHCGASYPVDEARAARRLQVRDTGTDRDDVVVLTLACPRCGRLGRAEADGAALAAADAAAGAGREPGPDPDDVDPTEVEPHGPPPAGSTPETPLGEDRRFFDDGGPGTLAEQGPLVDEQGEDIRQYTGEPVETEEGWVVPRQQNVGPGNEAGGGEFPDPHTPSAMPKDDGTT
jgi:hypothetical protein